MTSQDVETPSVTFADVLAARERIGGMITRTPLLASESLSALTNSRLRVKAENLQRTGAFKVRGALNAISMLTPEERKRGVVTFSAGNHGSGLAFAAAQLDVGCTVFMAQNAVAAKVEAIRGHGAVVEMRPTIQEAFAAMEARIAERGAVFISPFGHPAGIAGQGTVGLEVIEDFPEVEQIIVPIGGGGLISGIAIAMAELKPDVRIVGVEPDGAPTMSRALEAGAPVRLESVQTIADGLAAPFTTDLNLSIVQRHVDDVVLVSEDELAAATRLALSHTRLVAEPAAAAALAALTTGKAAVPVGAETVILFTGGNIDLERLRNLL